jgi:hypothetical protein
MNGPVSTIEMEVTVKRPTTLVQALLRQAALDLDLSVERDSRTIESRCEHEGLSFLTITLPTLSDALEQGLENGTFTCPTSFSRHGRLPRFLGGFFKRVFDKDGTLLDEPDADVIYYIRQVCRFFKKLKISCTPDREVMAEQRFLEVEGELGMRTAECFREDVILDSISGILWSQVFPAIDPLDLVCSHGPGVTADRKKANQRFQITHWNERSELTFPSDLHCFPNYGLAAAASGIQECRVPAPELEFLSLPEEMPVRVVFVPKTQTTPRVIAIEPSHMQFMQQALKDWVYPILETHRLTKHSIRFTRQDVNQQLAYRSSKDKRLATLDLKDASDRVHLELVRRIFKTSGILEYLEDSRSLSATLPSGANVVLHKFASMGSAMCFPVEAMVFYTLVLRALHVQDGVRPSSKTIAAYSRMVSIYGDDLIVPVEYADAVVRSLECYLLKVNVGKSFKKGNFRESCGGDFWNGVAVNPVYARTVPLDNVRHWSAGDVMSWNATADLFYQRGLWHIAQVIRDLLAQVVRTPIPRAREPGTGLAHLSWLFTTDLRFDADSCGFRQRRLVFTPLKQKDEIDGNELACLNKWGLRGRTATHSWCSSDPRLLNGDLGSSRVPPNDTCESGPGDSFSRDISIGTALSPVLLPYCNVANASKLCGLAALVNAAGPCESGHEVRLRLGLTGPERRPSLADILEKDTPEMDFDSSVKRGDFKSKRRWVSLVS